MRQKNVGNYKRTSKKLTSCCFQEKTSLSLIVININDLVFSIAYDLIRGLETILDSKGVKGVIFFVILSS